MAETTCETAKPTAELLDAVRAGDHAARDRYAKAYFPLVQYHLNAQQGLDPTTRDEVYSECLLSIAAALGRIVKSTMTVEEADDYMACAIRSTALRESSQSQPGSLKWWQAVANESKPPEERIKPLNYVELKYDHAHVGERGPDTRGDVWEEILHCCVLPGDREIVEGLAKGKKARTIAKQLDIEPSTLYMRRADIKQRYEEMQDARA